MGHLEPARERHELYVFGNYGPHFGNVVTLIPNGPIQAIDFALTESLPLGPIGLHFIENYFEHFGLPASLPPADLVGKLASFASELILAVTGPFEPKTTLPVPIGGSATISRDFLWSTDSIFGDDQLTYSVLAPPSHGTLLLNGNPTSHFTQDDINRGVVQYREDGSRSS